LSVYLLIPLIGVVLGLTLLTVLSISGKRHVAKSPFTMFLFFMTLWGFLIFMMRASLDLDTALVWEKFVLWAILSASLFFFRFAGVLTGVTLSKYLVYPLYSLYFIILGLLPTRLVVNGIQITWYGKAPEVGLLFPLFVLCSNLFIVLSALMLKKHYKTTMVIGDRVRDQYLITGITVMIIGATLDFLPSLGVKIYPLGIIGNILFCLITTAAMVRHNLLDMKVVVRKGTTISLAAVLIFGAFGSLIYLLSYFFRDFMNPVSITMTVITVFVAALLFRPVLNRLQFTVDRWFFRERYDHIQNLKRFTWDTKSNLDLEHLSNTLVEAVANGMQSQGVYLLLPVPSSGNYITYSYAGQKNQERIHFSANSPFVAAMTCQNDMVDCHDMDVIPAFACLPSHERGAMENSSIELMVPLRNNGQMVGILLLGKKASHEPFSDEERHLLQTVSTEVAINLENANHVESIKRKHSELQKAMDGVVHAVSLVVGSRDPYTAGHQRRVAELARQIARSLGLSEWQTLGIFIAGLLHDVGKVSVPLDILSKPGKINNNEFDIIKDHCRVGYDILRKIEFPWPVTQAILQHHERLNGSGYPHGLTGNDIILEARILGVADVVEAMSSHRPYRPALGLDSALLEIKRGSGSLYDPEIVDACLRLLNNHEPEFDRMMAVAETTQELVFEVIK
jgi:putative nucleotidyltransferase with HDIG domain